MRHLPTLSMPSPWASPAWVAAAIAIITVWPAYEPQFTAAVTVTALVLEIARGLNDRSRR